jgi:hypothetical protein
MSDTLKQWSPPLVGFALGLLSGYLLGYFNHDLTQRRDADGRRRKYRDDMRAVALRFDTANWMNFVETYETTVPIVRDASLNISEDIRWWKRGNFTKHRDRYCGFKRADLELPRPKTPAGLDDWMKANKKKREDTTAALKSLLEDLARDAV